MSKTSTTSKLPAFVKNDKENYVREIETIKTIIERTAVLKSYYDKYQTDKSKQSYKELLELRKMLFDFSSADSTVSGRDDPEASDNESDNASECSEAVSSYVYSEDEGSDEEYDE